MVPRLGRVPEVMMAALDAIQRPAFRFKFLDQFAALHLRLQAVSFRVIAPLDKKWCQFYTSNNPIDEVSSEPIGTAAYV